MVELTVLSKIVGASGPIIAENRGVIWNPRTLSKHIQGDYAKALGVYEALIPHWGNGVRQAETQGD